MTRAAIVLGGGRASRMGTDKLALRIDGATLLERVVQAAGKHASTVVVAGPRLDALAGVVHFAPEDPPFGGPVAGIASALRHIGEADEVLLLAGDVAHPGAAVDAICREPLTTDGVLFVDAEGRRQSLLGRYRTRALRAAVEELADAVRGAALGRLLHGLELTLVPAPAGLTDDVDTPEDADRLGIETPPQVVRD